VAHRAWGVAHRLAGEHAEAERRLEAALAVFHSLEATWQAGCTWLELGELAAATGRRAEAEAHLARALAAFEAMQAAPDIARTRTALSGLAASPPSR
jgi:hypothetical protein